MGGDDVERPGRARAGRTTGASSSSGSAGVAWPEAGEGSLPGRGQLGAAVA